MKILIINPFGIGDVIFSTPLLEVLRKNFPDSYIAYVCNKRVSALMSANPKINRVFVYEKDDYRQVWKKSKLRCIKKVWSSLKGLKNEKFDVSIDLSLTYQYSLLLKFIGVKKRIGFNYRKRGRFLTDKIEIDGFSSKHVIEYYLDTLKPLNVSFEGISLSPKIYASQESLAWADNFLKTRGVSKSDVLIGMVPGCGASWGNDALYRRWDKKNFASLLKRIAGKLHVKVILLGNSKEIELCNEVASLAGVDVINACGKTSMHEFIGVLARCNIVVTNDGGPMHMAVGLGVPTVSVFGPVDESIYGPYPKNGKHVVLSRKDLPCRPCYKKFKYKKCENRACLDSITAEEAFNAVEKVLAK